MCGFLVECMFFCKHCHRAKAQLQLNKYIVSLSGNNISCRFHLIVRIHTRVILLIVGNYETRRFRNLHWQDFHNSLHNNSSVGSKVTNGHTNTYMKIRL
jgi:hypothetical protein